MNRVCIDSDNACTNKEQYCCETNWYGSCTRWCERCLAYRYSCDRTRIDCTGKLSNYDTVYGIWNLLWTFYDLNGKKAYSDTGSVGVNSHDYTGLSKSYYVEGDGYNINYCTITVDNYPTKEVCNNEIRYRDVTKTRTVTKWHDVQKQKPEIRYQPLFNALNLQTLSWQK